MSAHDYPPKSGAAAPGQPGTEAARGAGGDDEISRPAFLSRAALARSVAPDAPAAGDGAAEAPSQPATAEDAAARRAARRQRRMRRKVRGEAEAAETGTDSAAAPAASPDSPARQRLADRLARRRSIAAGEADAGVVAPPADDAAADDAAAAREASRRARVERRQAEREARRMARPQAPVRPAASRARFQRRHLGLLLSLVLVILLPVAVSSWYLYARAVDQYASFLGFSVRSESGPSSSDLLGGLTSSLVGITSSSSSDTDILYKFIQSRDLVERVDARLDLRTIWSKAPGDPIFGYRGNASLEDLLAEWERKVQVYYDNGMIDLRVQAFDPVDARNVAQAILDESTVLINQLNDVAREDALRYSRTELDEALERLRSARQAVTQFRNRHQLVDPSADVQGQIGVVSSLQQQLAEQLVGLGLLRANAQPNDPRIEQTELRIRVIREQMEAERQKFGSEVSGGELLSELVGQYESLSVDREFAERTYTAALAAFDTARGEAQRQSRYLAAYVKPTLAQEAEYPQRGRLIAIIAGFLILIWVVGVLIFYSLRDRR